MRILLAHVPKGGIDMAAKQPSEQKLKAAKAQSIADRTGTGSEAAREMQSRADQSDIVKHGQ